MQKSLASNLFQAAYLDHGLWASVIYLFLIMSWRADKDGTSDEDGWNDIALDLVNDSW